MDSIVSNYYVEGDAVLSLYSANDIQNKLKDSIKQRRKQKKLSRNALASISTVPASTIKKFETTGQISLRQFILLWQSVDSLERLHELTKNTVQAPATIDDVLNNARF